MLFQLCSLRILLDDGIAFHAEPVETNRHSALDSTCSELSKERCFSLITEIDIQNSKDYSQYEMFIRGVVEFVKDVGKEEVCSKITTKIRKFWPNDEKINRKRKFRAAFEYYKEVFFLNITPAQ